jgi:hypothetical protein
MYTPFSLSSSSPWDNGVSNQTFKPSEETRRKLPYSMASPRSPKAFEASSKSHSEQHKRRYSDEILENIKRQYAITHHIEFFAMLVS